MKTPLRPVLLILAGCSLLASACGKKEASTGEGASSASPSTDPAAAPATASGQKVEITGNDTMKYSITEIRAKPGETINLTLTNVGSLPKAAMGHNWILLTPGTNIDSFVLEAAQAAATDYIPKKREGDILAHTRLLGPKEKHTITFKAPNEPGRYPYICSFPAHVQAGMRGELIVE